MGVGNIYRSDDAIGILVARKINEFKFEDITVQEHSGEGTSLMEAWNGHERVIIIDAVSSGSSPGDIHHIDASKNTIPAKYFSCSSHNFGVAEAIEMARTLDQLPKHILLYGIEGKNFHPSEIVSPEIIKAGETVTKEILESISSLT